MGQIEASQLYVLSQQNMFELLGLNFHDNGVFAVEGLAVGWSMVLVGSDSRFPVQGVRQSKAGHFAQNLSKHRTLDKGHSQGEKSVWYSYLYCPGLVKFPFFGWYWNRSRKIVFPKLY